MVSDLRIGRAFATPSTTGSSFNVELRGLLWIRCVQVIAIGLGIYLLGTFIETFLVEPIPAVFPELESTIGWLRYGHLASFGAAFLLLLAIQRWLCHLKLMLFAFVLFSINIFIGVFTSGICTPGNHPFFEIALLLFLPAALVPWRAGFQIGLGVVALISGIYTEIYYNDLPAYGQFWSERGGHDAYVNYIIWGFTGTVILTVTSYITSRTLYSLRKSIHNAKRLGNYLIKGELGQGGMGKVYLAEHAMICRLTAVKVLEMDDRDSPESMLRFEQEVQLSAHLTHPNTIGIFDYGRTGDNVFYYAMEYLNGLDLQEFVEQYGPLVPARVVHILTQICGSLSEAHAMGIIHRDIKPSNIFLSQRGGICDFVKVLDFGLAKQVKNIDDGGLTKTGMLFGTPRYIAPEAIYGQEKNDARADLYNLGGVAYWLLTGQPPFASSSSVELLVDHVKTLPEKPSTLCETPLPPELEDIIMKCLQKKPDERFQCAAELKAALLQVPLDEPWDDEKAGEWWELHGLLNEPAVVCRGDAEKVGSLVAI